MGPTIPSLFETAERGDRLAADALFTALYHELHGVAKRELARRGYVQGLGATTLLHEAYIDMAARSGASFPDSAHFLKYASRVMRGLVIDHVRSRHALKRGGQFHLTSFATDSDVPAPAELTRISDALDALAEVEAELVEIVDLKFFCGFSFAEIAAMRGVSERTVQRQWDKARIYLHRVVRDSSAI